VEIIRLFYCLSICIQWSHYILNLHLTCLQCSYISTFTLVLLWNQMVPTWNKQSSTCRIWDSQSAGYEEYYLLGYKPCSLLSVNWCFRGSCHLQFQGRISQTRSQHEIWWQAEVAQVFACLYMFLWNISWLSRCYEVFYSRSWNSSKPNFSWISFNLLFWYIGQDGNKLTNATVSFWISLILCVCFPLQHGIKIHIIASLNFMFRVFSMLLAGHLYNIVR
jgi:hypothetical protein